MSRAFTAATLLVLCPAAAWAQDQDRPFQEQERRQAMEKEFVTPPPEVQDFLYDYGGWLRFEFARFGDEPIVDRRTYRFTDLRLWGSAIFQKRYRLYARFQTSYVDFNEGTQFGNDDNDLDLMRVDQAWFDAPFEGALGEGSRVNLRLGRQYLALGTGLLMNSVLDGLSAKLSSGPLQARFVAVQTDPKQDDLDSSRPDAGSSRRLFVGLEAEYRCMDRHRPYAILLLQRDLNDEDPDVAGQDFEYHSVYLAFGIRGELAKSLGYSAELDFETGTSVATGTTDTEKISATAFQLNLDHYVPGPMSPVIYFSYLFGSGDPDRLSPTDTIGGNAAGSTDKGFHAFGFLLTGFSLAPRLSNLHVVRAGALIKPAEGTTWGDHLETGLTFYLFRKAKASGGISDSRAFLDDADVGQEADLFVRWRMYSDLQLALNYGVFLPGDAYDDGSRRDYFSLSATVSF